MTSLKNILKCIIAIILVSYSTNDLKGQQDSLTINLATIGQITGAIESVTNNILIQVANNYAQEKNVYFVVGLVGQLTDGTTIDIDNRLTAEDHIVNIPATGFTFTLTQLIEQFQNSTLTDYSIRPASIIAQLESTRQLPAGDYSICLEARSLATNQLVSAPGANNCLAFTITNRNPPIIQSPLDNTWIGYSDQGEIQIIWSHDIVSSSTTYTVEIRKFPSNAAANAFMVQGSPHNLFETSTTQVLLQEDINSWYFNTINDNAIDLDPGDVLAVRVTAVSETSTFLNLGHSNIHVFIYGVPNSELCNNPSLTADWAFPSVGDTLPFTDLFAVARFQPSCDNILEMNAAINFTRSLNGSVVGSTTVGDYENNWRRGPGPAKYLRDYFTNHYPTYGPTFFYPNDSEYEQYLPFLHNTATTFSAQRGEKVNIFGVTEFTIKEIPSNIERTQTLNLNAMNSNGIVIGMPRPELESPAHDAVMRPGTIQFDFNTGLEPGNPLPPFKIFKLDGSSQPIVPGLSVNEKCVLQVARDNTFSPASMVFCKLKKIQGNPYNNSDNFNEDNPNFQPISNTFDLTPQRQFDQDHFTQQVYKDLTVSHDFTAVETLYWRVIWLRFPDAYNIPSPCGSGIDITPAHYYHASPVRRLVISNDAAPDPVVGGGDAPPPPPPPGSLDCERICNTPEIPEAQRVAATGISIGDIVRIGDYSFAVSTINGSTEYNGTGILRLNSNIQLNVNFSGARINSARQMFAGTVNAESENRSDLPRTNRAEMAAIVDGISELRRITEALSGAPTSLPLGIDFTADSELRIVAALDKATFTPTTARASYLAGVKLPEEMDGLSLLFAADEVCLNPNGNAGAGIYKLAANLDATLDNGWAIGISGGRDTLNTTYVEFDCVGFKALAFRGRLVFSRDALVPENVATGEIIEGQVAAVFGAKINRDAKFLIGLTFDKPFQFTAVPQLGFTVTNAILDFSESENYPGMRFPSLYDINRLPPLLDPETPSPFSPEVRLRNSWTGFYLKELSLRLPKDLATARPGIGIADVLIDPTGVSFEIRTTGVWSTAQESGRGYSLSLDTLAIGLVQSTTGYGRISGGIGLPIFEEGDLLNYSAVLSFGETPAASGESAPRGSDVNFLFRIKPDATGVKIPMWDIARITLAPSTRVDLAIGSAFEFSFSITGDVTFTSSNRDRPARDGEMSINFPSIKLENLAFTTARSGIRGRISLQNGGTNTQLWSQASPQKDVSGFPINLNEISIAPVLGSLSRYDIRFDLTVNFGDKISGGADLGFRFNLGREGSPDFSRFTFEEFLTPTSISIRARDMGGLTLEGSISFCNVGASERFIGQLKVGIPSLGEINLYADFGTQRNNPSAPFNSADNFSFFAIEGSVILSTGITLFPGVALYGIGGGVFYHMRRTGPLPTLTAPPVNATAGATEATSDRSTLPPATPIGCASAPFEPHFLTFLGFGFKAYLGDNGGGSAYNFDIGIEAVIAGNPDGSVKGLQKVIFKGNLYVSCGIGRGDNTAPLRAQVDIAWTKGIDGNDNYEGIHGIIKVYLNLYGVVTGAGAGNELVDAVFHGDNSGLWYFYLGAPEGVQDRTFPSPGYERATSNYPGPAGIKVLDFLSVKTYFMIGQGIPDLPPPHPLIESILAAAGPDQDRVEGKLESAEDLPREYRGPEQDSGDGFAHGLTFQLNASLNFLLFYATLDMAFGYNINLRQYPDRTCRIISGPGGTTSEERPLGINGWYAKGDAFAGLRGELGIGVNFDFFQAKVPIINLGCAISIFAAFPGPEYFKGRAGLYYSILNGAVTGRCSFAFEVGNKCYDPNYSPLDGLKFITDVKPEGSQVSVYTKAEASFAFAMDRVLPLKDEQYEGEEELIRYFRPQFKRFVVTNNTNGQTVAFTPPTIVENGYLAKCMANEALPQNKDFTVRAEVIVFERINGSWVQVLKRDGSEFVDFMEKRFTTGPHPITLPENNILTTYPIQKQRFFMVGEKGEKGTDQKGWLQTQIGDPIIIEPAGERAPNRSLGRSTVSYEVLMESPDDRSIQYRIPATRNDSKTVTWQMPASMRLNTRYRLRVIKKVITDYSALTAISGGSSSLAFTTIAQRYQVSGMEAEASTSNITNRTIASDPSSSENGRNLVIYEYFFKTSQFNTLAEKMTANRFQSANKTFLAYSINFIATESFDEFDKNGYTSAASGVRVMAPLVNIEEAYSHWSFIPLKSQLYTFADNLNRTRWTHQFSPPTIANTMYSYFMGILPRNSSHPSWAFPDRNAVDVMYTQSFGWEGNNLPQNVNFGLVSPPLNGDELTFPEESRETTYTLAPRAPGVISGGGLPTFTIFNANELAWSVHNSNLQRKTQSIISRLNQVMAFSRPNEYTTVVGIADWMTPRGSAPLGMSFSSVLSTSMRFNTVKYTPNLDYSLDWNYHRPSNSRKTKRASVNWRL
jgi:hypothetical protein